MSQLTPIESYLNQPPTLYIRISTRFVSLFHVQLCILIFYYVSCYIWCTKFEIFYKVSEVIAIYKTFSKVSREPVSR